MRTGTFHRVRGMSKAWSTSTATASGALLLCRRVGIAAENIAFSENILPFNSDTVTDLSFWLCCVEFPRGISPRELVGRPTRALDAWGKRTR